MGVPDKFPSGMKAIGKQIHAQNCRFGVYSAASERTCANYSASLFNEQRDAHTMAIEWEIDFLKQVHSHSCTHHPHTCHPPSLIPQSTRWYDHP